MNQCKMIGRQFLGAKRGRLPTEFQEVEWVGFDSKQSGCSSLLQTFISISDSLRFKFKIQVYQTAGFIGNLFVKSNGSTSEASRFNLIVSANMLILDYGSGDGYARITGSISEWKKMYGSNPVEIEVGNNYIKYVDGDVISQGKPQTFETNFGNLKVFADGSIIGNRYFYIQAFDGDELIADYVPAVKKDTLKSGFYDLITNQFIESVNWLYGQNVN